MDDSGKKVLFLTTPSEDYLQDSLLYGLRQILGDKCIDYPKKDIVYKSCPIPKSQLYGRGFSIWKLLPDIDPALREDVLERILDREFDRIIFGRIWRQRDLFDWAFGSALNFSKHLRYAFLDGEDGHDILMKPLSHGLYFKREYFGDKPGSNIQPICFGIPKIKIRTSLPTKDKLFTKQVQCEEAYLLPEVNANCQRQHAFEGEEAYREDISRSYFAVTMKKGGWDCMRHYEICSNLTVPCFYHLSDKPQTSAPHQLIDMHNCISFNSAAELKDKTTYLLNHNYSEVQKNVAAWALENSSENVAKKLLETWDTTPLAPKNLYKTDKKRIAFINNTLFPKYLSYGDYWLDAFRIAGHHVDEFLYEQISELPLGYDLYFFIEKRYDPKNIADVHPRVLYTLETQDISSLKNYDHVFTNNSAYANQWSEQGVDAIYLPEQIHHNSINTIFRTTCAKKP
jgi:hypothetical protein